MTPTILKLSQELGHLLKKANLLLATSESCTAGGLAYAITTVSGSSDWFERGFVTYSNLSKIELLGVSDSLLETYGAVSAEVAEAMALGTLAHSHADLVLSITGIAGPDGGSSEKPVGMVWFGLGKRAGIVETRRQYLSGSREEIRHAAITYALQWLISTVS